jgi:hypothetical protein
MNILYLDSKDIVNLLDDRPIYPDTTPGDKNIQYVNLEWFLSKINKMAEERMLKTHVLEGAHYNAMKSLAERIENGEHF